jgi:hypothetical protein
MSEPTLLPCPFCGGEANEPSYDGQYMSASVICMACAATTFGTGFKLSATDEARSNWNQRPTCEWAKDPDEEYMPDTWDSACGEKWTFNEGGPVENSVRFCQGCGKTVKLAAAQPPAMMEHDDE